jgi:hypothetical protein
LAAAASLGGASIDDIFNSRQLSDVLAVRHANVQQSQTAGAASLQSGSIQDFLRARELGDAASVRGSDVVQSQTARSASFQGRSLEDILTDRELGDATSVKSANVLESQAGRAASLQGAGIPDSVIKEVLGESLEVKKAKNEGGDSFIQLDSSSNLQTGDSVRFSGKLHGLKDASGNTVSADTLHVGAKNSAGKEFQLFLTAEDAKNGTNALSFSKDNNLSDVSIRQVITPESTQKVTGSTTLGQLNGGGDFSLKVNGSEFQFDANTTIDSVISQINQSGSVNVTASFNSETRSISLVSDEIGDGKINVSGDLAESLALKGDGTTSVEGQDQVVGGSFIKLKSGSDLSTGDKIQLNGSLDGLKDASGNAVSGDTFFVGSRNGSEKEFALFLTAEDARNNTNALSFSADNKLSGLSVQKVLSEPSSTPVTANTTLGQLGAFGAVESQSGRVGDAEDHDGDDSDGGDSGGSSQTELSLSVNGKSFSFGSGATIANVIDKINQSEGLNVTASFNADTGSISLVANQAGAGEVTVSGDLADSLGLAGSGTRSVSGRDEVVGGNFVNLGADAANFRDGDKVQLNGTLKDSKGQDLTGDFILGAREGSSDQFSLYRVQADGTRGDAVQLAEGNDVSNVSVQKVLAEARTEQVSTETRLGSLDNLGSFSFSVNGASFNFNADTKIGDVINQINQSGDANVTASFNTETRTISLVSNQAGAGNVSVSGDLADRLSLTGSSATAVSGRDAVAGGSFIELNAGANGTLATGDKVQLNGSLSGLKDANGNAVSGDTFFVGSRNGSDKEFALFLTAEDARNNTNAVSFSEGTNLAGVSVQKVLSEAGTTRVNANTKLGQLDNLDNFNFSVNGADFKFDADTTISTVLSRINGSSSAGVNATFNADTRQISFTNRNTGEGEVSVSGGLADRLGLNSSGAKAVSGQNAVATISGGPQDGRVISSRDNTLSTSESGVEGLTFTVRGTGSATLTDSHRGSGVDESTGRNDGVKPFGSARSDPAEGQ